MAHTPYRGGGTGRVAVSCGLCPPKNASAAANRHNGAAIRANQEIEIVIPTAESSIKAAAARGLASCQRGSQQPQDAEREGPMAEP